MTTGMSQTQALKLADVASVKLENPCEQDRLPEREICQDMTQDLESHRMSSGLYKTIILTKHEAMSISWQWPTVDLCVDRA